LRRTHRRGLTVKGLFAALEINQSMLLAAGRSQSAGQILDQSRFTGSVIS
jgi:hypothetical protein